MTSQGSNWQGNNAPLPRVAQWHGINGGRTLFMEVKKLWERAPWQYTEIEPEDDSILAFFF